MSTNLEQFIWPTSFACTLVTEQVVIPNLYSLNISIEPLDNGQNNIPLGFKKIRHFVDNYLHNSIFIFKDHPLVSSFENIDTDVVLFPTDPYDYFVGSVLYSKFLSITSKFFHIDLITIDSSIGDNVQYCIRDPEECGLDLSGENWWNMDTADTGRDNNASWGELALDSSPRFNPRIIKGGRSENQ